MEELKASLTKLVADNPDSPEAASWRQQLQELGQWSSRAPSPVAPCGDEEATTAALFKNTFSQRLTCNFYCCSYSLQ